MLQKYGIESELLTELEGIAREASKNAYTPYSQFSVGAAILTGSGKIFSGCNVENASYGMTTCAERIAIFKAVSEGEQQVKAVVTYTPTVDPLPPCGACRQVINEFGPECVVVCLCDSEDKRMVVLLKDILPGAVNIEHVKK